MTNTRYRLERMRAPRSYPLTYHVAMGEVSIAKVLPVTAILADRFGGHPDAMKRHHIVTRDNLATVRAAIETSASAATAAAWDALAAVVDEHEDCAYNRLAIVDMDAFADDWNSLEEIVRQVSPACVFAAPTGHDPNPFRYLHRSLVAVVGTVANTSDSTLEWNTDSPIHLTLQSFLDSNSRYPIPGFQYVHVPVRPDRRTNLDFNSAIQATQIVASVHDMTRDSLAERFDTPSEINEWLSRLSVSHDVTEDEWPWQRYHRPLYHGSVVRGGLEPCPTYEVRVALRCCKGRVISVTFQTTSLGHLECHDFSARAEGI